MKGYFAVPMFRMAQVEPGMIKGPYPTLQAAMAAGDNIEYDELHIVLGEFKINQTVRIVSVPYLDVHEEDQA